MGSFKGLYALLILSLLGSSCLGERILFLLPLASRSHVHVFEPLMRALGERGHDIVALSPIKSPNMPATVRTIHLITLDDLLGKMPSPFEQRKIGWFKQMFNSSSFDHLTKACEKALQNPELYKLLENEKFDLVITDIFLNYCMMGIIPTFNASQIHVCTIAPFGQISNIVGSRLPLSFVPSVFLQYSDKMNFKERLSNTLFETLSYYGWDWMMVRKMEAMYRRLMPNGESLPDIDDIFYNTSMIFANSHFSLTYARPLLPDIQEVGGMHTRPAKKLPKDLDDFLTGSGKDGFIFFSLGSIVKANEMPESTRKVFINVFSRLKQRVIWKWETETMPDLPKNVKLSKWLPQQDILGHPNIKLFMSHGGLLSTQESVYHGVPVLGLPVFGDQDLNVRQAEKGGYAKFVEILDITEEKLEEAILELINNPSYSEKVKSLSKVFRDQPQTPLDRALYWTEYVLRHKGAPHLRSGARDLNFFQYWLLDVVAVLALIAAVSLYITFIIFRAILRRICSFGKGKNKKVHFKKE